MDASRKTPTQRDHNDPGHGYDTRGPVGVPPDNVAALVCKQLPTGYRAVTVIHGGDYLDQQSTISSHYNTKEMIDILMDSGPVLNLGMVNAEYRWQLSEYDKYDKYTLISLSRHKKRVPKEQLQFDSLAALAAHARDKNIHHAYIWTPFPDDHPARPQTVLQPDPLAWPPDEGVWTYLRTMPHALEAVPLSTRTQHAVSSIIDSIYAPDDCTGLLGHFHESENPPNCELQIKPHQDDATRVLLLIDHDGLGRALLIETDHWSPSREILDAYPHGRNRDVSDRPNPADRRRTPPPPPRTRELPLTREEQQMLAVNLRNAVETQRAEDAETDARVLEHQTLHQRAQQLREARLQQIRTTRKDRGLTQKALSAISGVTVARISNLEQHGHSDEVYLQLAPHLGITGDALITDPGPPALAGQPEP